jgi:hypothetical protein
MEVSDRLPGLPMNHLANADGRMPIASRETGVYSQDARQIACEQASKREGPGLNNGRVMNRGAQTRPHKSVTFALCDGRPSTANDCYDAGLEFDSTNQEAPLFPSPAKIVVFEC